MFIIQVFTLQLITPVILKEMRYNTDEQTDIVAYCFFLHHEVEKERLAKLTRIHFKNLTNLKGKSPLKNLHNDDKISPIINVSVAYCQYFYKYADSKSNTLDGDNHINISKSPKPPIKLKLLFYLSIYCASCSQARLAPVTALSPRRLPL